MIRRLFLHQKRLLAKIFFWLVLAAVVELGSAVVFGSLIDHIADLNHLRFYAICAGFIVLHFIAQYGRERIMEKAKRQTRVTLLEGAIQAYLAESNTTFHQTELNAYLNKLSTQMDTLMDQYMTPLLKAMGLAVNFVFGCVYFFTLSPLILGFLLAGSIVMVGFNALFQTKLKASQQAVLDQQSQWLARVQTMYHNFSVIKNYDLEKWEQNALRKTIHAGADAVYSNHLLLARLDAINFEIGYVLFFGQVFLCGLLLRSGAAAGLAVSAMQVSNTITNPVINFSTIRNRLVSNAPILSSFLALRDRAVSSSIPSHDPDSIAVQIDELAIQGKTILHDIDFTFRAHEKVMIVGPSGCGKTTLFNVLKGDIALDPPLPDFHAYCSIVEQDAPLFPGSVADNICLDTPRDEKRLAEVLKQVGLSHLDPNRRLRLDHDVLSGGERQRIQLARALYQRRPWLLLDEAFSALDTQTTAAIERVFLERSDLAMVSICHKPITANMELYDAIVFMERGTIQHVQRKED
ncbi:ABC transporter ATP-binding protein [uncultured Dubosiella sp.]|uniref:ATP-binding cassette domain-containing protein n=1 Tax=uncultured Dubosiella sp. TaxID=1937011 RepID=UPI0025B011BD|nr:ABC transporter ATP-binding protein [uncultured Dubosiella sp.]